MNRGRIAETNRVENSVKRKAHWFLGLAVVIAAGLGGPCAFANTKSGQHHHYAAHAASHHSRAVASHAAHLAHRPIHLAHESARHHVEIASRHARHSHVQYASLHHFGSHHRYASARYRHSYLQCVPYAREISHIQLSGDAFLWWAEAAGRYARGNAPAEGAVLNFRPVGRMPLGHVAVVTSVIDSRTILTTQANWVRGTITNDVTMQDVSPNNDWSEVEVELGDSAKWGAPYPVYGFIYNRPDDGTVIASSTAQGNEVAEAPRAVVVQADAPDRNLQ